MTSSTQASDPVLNLEPKEERSNSGIYGSKRISLLRTPQAAAICDPLAPPLAVLSGSELAIVRYIPDDRM